MMMEFLSGMRTELMVTAVIFILLFIKLGRGMENHTLLAVTQVMLLAASALSFWPQESGSLFGGMFTHSALQGFQKSILLTGTYLVSLLFSNWLRRSPHMTEFLVLMLSSLLGMCFLISSAHLLMFYLSLELTTIPLAAMSNFDLNQKKSSEAAMKMILSSAFSSGILLFGISLVYGATGSLYFPEIAASLGSQHEPLTILMFLFLLSAFAFKMSIVPFHLWTADVYEGSPIPVTAFLSVMSKGAVAFALLTVLYTVFPGQANQWFGMIALLAVATMLIGNLFAIRQDNLKRFLAFSSIAQVGFILVAISGQTPVSITAVTYFVLVYMFSNLAAFGVAAVLEQPDPEPDDPWVEGIKIGGSETMAVRRPASDGTQKISHYRGLIKRSPLLTWIMALALFSLAGIPPTAGFFGKIFLLSAGAASQHYWLIIIAALNMIVSLYYYLKIVRVMFMTDPLPHSTKLYPDPVVQFGLIICSVGIVLVGLISWIYEYIGSLAH
jgi:NADH-quinone oxidoreductase subunit N